MINKESLKISVLGVLLYVNKSAYMKWAEKWFDKDVIGDEKRVSIIRTALSKK